MSKRKAVPNHVCRFCGVDLSKRRADVSVCGSTECRNRKARYSYSRRRTKKTCRQCGRVFTGTDKATNCGCPVVRKFRRTIQEMRCRTCDTFLGFRVVCVTRKASVLRSDLCGRCRAMSLLSLSLSMVGEKNPHWSGGRKKRMTLDQVRQFLSLRMKANNPMKSAVNREKMVATMKSRTYSRKRGAAHWLWRGNREPSFVLRARLNPWIKSVLARDGFKCVRCGRNRNLEVHHRTVSFADIASDATVAIGVNSLDSVDVSSETFNRISEYVVARHDLSVGETLCKTCHAEVDPRRRIGTA